MNIEHPGLTPKANIDQLKCFLAVLRVNPSAVFEFGEVSAINNLEQQITSEIEYRELPPITKTSMYITKTLRLASAKLIR